MRCANCECENPEGTKFCGECGTPLTRRCAGCGAENPPRFKFCGECGVPLAPQAQAVVSSQLSVASLQHLAPSIQPPDAGLRTAGPGRWTPAHLAERILAEQAAMEARGATEGERKTITALFADIKGSMDLIEDLDPEEARRIIDPA
ncbi:MAG: zinc ribbon domain-containing protein, partial [Deltaproteobacteria bacterium]|nr:zinc ribbon domain-containing protein [Deltaproteobacteria bacterium]